MVVGQAAQASLTPLRKGAFLRTDFMAGSPRACSGLTAQAELAVSLRDRLDVVVATADLGLGAASWAEGMGPQRTVVLCFRHHGVSEAVKYSARVALPAGDSCLQVGGRASAGRLARALLVLQRHARRHLRLDLAAVYDGGVGALVGLGIESAYPGIEDIGLRYMFRRR